MPKTIKHKKQPTEIKLVEDQSALFTQKIIGELDSGVNADPNANHNIMESIIINSMQKRSTCKTVKYNKYKHNKLRGSHKEL